MGSGEERGMGGKGKGRKGRGRKGGKGREGKVKGFARPMSNCFIRASGVDECCRLSF